ncbi:MAG: hypothetical protein JWO47_1044 [Candidatus Saccharibacteria bacterium]|nr:hypothetical protein [Candidatus Saccharibacteria bacterium]
MDPNNLNPGTVPPANQPPPPAEPKNPYHFIMNAPKPPKKQMLKTGSLRSRLLVIVGGAAVVIAAIILISSLLSRSSKQVTSQLTDIVAEQQEIIRVANLGYAGAAGDLETQSWATTTESTISSEQQALVKFLKQKNIVILPVVLNGKLNKKTDAALAAATTNGNYVTVFKATLQESLVTYAKDLKKSYQSVSSPEIKASLSDSYKNTVSLLK